MPLRCPRCRSLVEVPDQLNRYFGMPVSCHMCQRVFAVPPQSPFHDSSVPYSPVRQLERSISAERSNHERSCPVCRRRVRLPGLDTAIGPLDLSCPYCRAQICLQNATGVRPRFIASALSLGIVFGLAVLWLNHQGMIALHQLHLTEIVLEQTWALQDWVTEWYTQLRTAVMVPITCFFES